MKLTIYNGSPKGQKSNTKVLLDQFTKGFLENEDNSIEELYLNRFKNQDQFVESFEKAEQILLAFPLYHDSVPANVKLFIESLEPLSSKKSNPPIGYIVQSGFSEAIHSRFVEKYLTKLTKRLNSEYLGSIIKGGVEGVKIKPGWMTKKLFESFYTLGKIYGETGRFDEKIITQLAKPEKLTPGTIFFYKIMDKLGMTNFYWNSLLKKNDAFEKRFDTPYL